MLRAHGMLQRALVSLLLCPSSCCLQLRVAPTQHCRISTRGCPAAAAARAAHVCMQAPPPQPPQPPPPAVPLPAWVSSVNSALETSATATLLAFVALDMAGATALLGAICALRVSVGADFMLALAIAKALRGPRLALDTSLAALLGRTFPALRAVRLSLLFDEVAASWAAVASGFSEGRAEAAGKAASVEASGLPPGFTPRPGKREAAQLAAGRLISEHGLAYMAAKNIVGPASTLTLTLTLTPTPTLTLALALALALALTLALALALTLTLTLTQVGPASTLLVLAALRSGGRAQAATASLMRLLRVTAGPAGALAGQMALAVTLSSALFPLVVLGAAELGPRLAARDQSR